MEATKLFNEFFHSEKSGGTVLIICTIASLVLANSGVQAGYLKIWDYPLAGQNVAHWIDDGLMVIFFLLVGLELEREVYIGELSTLKKALLPVIAALGGMVIPALIHFLFNKGTNTQAGAGIPMATDIAFALAVLSLLGDKIPNSLKIFLTALAVIDDLGAILVIAIFYTGSLDWFNLSISLGTFAVLLVLNRLKVMNLIPYLIGGIIMWYFMLHSGVHATISGVLLAFAIPFGSGEQGSISYRLQQFLHTPVAFIILPLFALSNTAVVIPKDWIHALVEINSIGIFLGLVVGKPAGIFLFSFISSKLKVTRLPDDLKWIDIFGAGVLGGIGFTMSIFVTLLAFDEARLIDQSKISIMISSMVAGTTGYLLLRALGSKQSTESKSNS